MKNTCDYCGIYPKTEISRNSRGYLDVTASGAFMLASDPRLSYLGFYNSTNPMEAILLESLFAVLFTNWKKVRKIFGKKNP